jgi:hypothetical protein
LSGESESGLELHFGSGSVRLRVQRLFCRKTLPARCAATASRCRNHGAAGPTHSSHHPRKRKNPPGEWGGCTGRPMGCRPPPIILELRFEQDLAPRQFRIARLCFALSRPGTRLLRRHRASPSVVLYGSVAIIRRPYRKKQTAWKSRSIDVFP